MIVYANNIVRGRDSSGVSREINVHADGDYHLGVSSIQSIITSTKNSTTTNIASNDTNY